MSQLAFTRQSSTLLLLLLFLAAGPLLAQDEGPAVDTRTDRPTSSEGTNIVGDRESPIGLFIMPWRESAAQADMDRPARLLQADMQPIDEPVFVRQIEYHRALTGALENRNEISPNVPAPAAPTTP